MLGLLFPGMMLAGTLQNIDISPQFNTIGEYTLYTFTFTTDVTGSSAIPVQGSIKITFPQTFDLSYVLSASSSENDDLPGGFDEPLVNGSTVVCRRDAAVVTNVPEGSYIELMLAMVGNPETVGNYTIEIQTCGFDTNDVKDSGSAQAVITEPIDRFTFAGPPSAPRAGEPFTLSVTDAQDGSGRPASGVVQVSFDDGGSHQAPDGYTVPSLQPIIVNRGAGSAAQTLYLAEENVIIRGSANSTLKTVSLSIRPGDLQAFEVTGYPVRTRIGTEFPDPLDVRAQDVYLNPKSDYNGTLRFSSDDPNASLPAVFTFDDTSHHQFNGAEFILNSAGPRKIFVTDLDSGVADTSTVIDVMGIAISTISSTADRISQGQSAIPVTMRIDNLSSEMLTNLGAVLLFRSGTTLLDNEYVSNKTSGPSTIAGGGTALLSFTVDSDENATLGDVTINGQVDGVIAGQPLFAEGAVTPHLWTVERPAQIELIDSQIDSSVIARGQPGVPVRLTVRNGSTEPRADARVTGVQFIFTVNGNGVSDLFSMTADIGNPDIIAGGATEELLYYLDAADDAPTGTVTISGQINYQDVNSGENRPPLQQSDFLTFECVEGSSLQIIDIIPSQPAVTRSQESLWTVRVGVKNSSPAELSISFDPARSYIKFLKGTADQTGEYDIVAPVDFIEGGTSIPPNQTKYLLYTIRRVGQATGNILLYSRIEATNGAYTTSYQSGIEQFIEVQQDADLRIEKIWLSQQSATAGDTQHPIDVWVTLKNFGGAGVNIIFNESELLFDNSPASIFGFTYLNPDSLFNFGSQLNGGDVDTLKFAITKIGPNPGDYTVDALIKHQEVNTLQSRIITSLPGGAPELQVQNPADFSISRVRASRRAVTGDISSIWTVSTLLNSSAGGGDLQVNLADPEQTWIRFSRDGIPQSGYVIERPLTLHGSGDLILHAGTTDSLVFKVTSTNVDTGRLLIRARVGVVELNRDLVLADSTYDDRADTIDVQLRADPVFLAGSVIPASVVRGSDVSFHLGVDNIGESDLVLDPENTQLSFTDGTISFVNSLDYAQTLPGGTQSTLFFSTRGLPTQFAPGFYTPIVTLVGKENGNTFSENLDLGGTQIEVTAAGQLAIQSINSSTESVTVGQTRPWNIDLNVRNNSSRTLRLDSAKVSFYHENAGLLTSSFTTTIPPTFTNGFSTLASNAAAALRITCLEVSDQTPLGKVFLSARIWMTDTDNELFQLDGQIDLAEDISVQSPANLRITAVRPSQNTVTRGQNSPWTIAVHLVNEGGSTVRLNLAQAENGSYLSFEKGNSNFSVLQPVTLHGSGILELAGNREDSLLFTVNSVGASSSLLGNCSILAVVSASELNTGRAATVSSQSFGVSGSVLIQNPALLRIDGFKIDTPSQIFVNVNQVFNLQALLKNPGSGDMVKQATLQFVTESGGAGFSFPEGNVTTLDSIAAGKTKMTLPGVKVNAPAEAGVSETFHVRISSSLARNTNTAVETLPSLTAADTTLTVNVQQPGEISLDEIYTSLDSLPAGYRDPITVAVVLSNSGGSTIAYQRPSYNDINVLGQPPGFNEFNITPLFSSGDTLVYGGESDTLFYQLRTTALSSGDVNIDAAIRARDINDTTRTFLLQGNVSLYVNTTSLVQILATEVDSKTPNIDAEGVGHVNVEQLLDIGVLVQNQGGQELDSVWIELSSDKSRLLSPPLQLITGIGLREIRRAQFTVVADTVENLIGEKFRSTISRAVGTDGGPAKILDPIDSTATVAIHTPAVLQIVRTRNMGPNADRISLGQTFDVAVDVRNYGTETARDVLAKLNVIPLNLVAVKPQELFEVPGDSTITVPFQVLAGEAAGVAQMHSVLNQAKGANSGEPVEILSSETGDSTAVAVLERGAQLNLSQVITSVDRIDAGDVQSNWLIYAVVENSGSADLQFFDVASDNITLVVDGQADPEYRIQPPAKLATADDLVLQGGRTDTLIYTVTKNGDFAGRASIKVELTAYDRNIGESTALSDTGSTEITVSSQAYVKIDRTSITSNVQDETGAGLINRNQPFQVSVKVTTGQLLGVDSVVVALSSDGASISSPSRSDTVIIDEIPRVVTAPRFFHTWPMMSGLSPRGKFMKFSMPVFSPLAHQAVLIRPLFAPRTKEMISLCCASRIQPTWPSISLSKPLLIRFFRADRHSMSSPACRIWVQRR